MRKPTFWFPTMSDTNQAVQLQKMARGLNNWIKKVQGLYSLCSENKGANQLRGYREADLRLCYRICKKPLFSQRGSLILPAGLLAIFVSFQNIYIGKSSAAYIP